MLEEIYAEVRAQMSSSIDALKRDLAGIRTGRASPALLDGIRIDYYGTPHSPQPTGSNQHSRSPG